MKPVILALSALLALPAGQVTAQMKHDHAGHMKGSMAAAPNLPGDDAFGAIAEIVAMLSADPETDWTRVSIDALRAHLLDMDAVVKGPAPATRDIDGGIEVTVSTAGPAGAAAARMVPAHAPVLANETGWDSEVTPAGGGLVWRVTAQSEADTARIRALGFFGLLATGAHHQAHHLAIASGDMAH